MPNSFPVGQAPWETSPAPSSAPSPSGGSYAVGQAPWEQASTDTSAPAFPQSPSLSQSLWNGLVGFGAGAANAVVGGAADLGAHLGQAAAIGTGKAVSAVTGNHTLENKVNAKLATPQTNMFGANLAPLTPETLSGDVLKTGAEAGALLAAPASLPGVIGVGAGVGAAQGAGQALQDQQNASGVATQGAIGGAIGGATAGAAVGLGKLIGAAGDKIMTSVIKPVKADIKDGFSIQTLKDFNLGGSLNTTLEKTQQAMNDLTSQLQAKLGASPNTIDLNNVADQTVKELTDASKLKGFGANTKIANALDQLKQEVQIVNSDAGVSIPDAQVIKQAAGSFGAWQYGKPDPESKAQEIVYNTFYNKLKTAIEQNSPDGVKEINQQLSRLIPVNNAVLRRLPIAERSNAISLNEMIGLVGSTIHPAALGPTVLNMISRSGAAGSLLSKLGPSASRLAVPASFATGQLASQAQGTQPDQALSGQ